MRLITLNWPAGQHGSWSGRLLITAASLCTQLAVRRLDRTLTNQSNAIRSSLAKKTIRSASADGCRACALYQLRFQFGHFRPATNHKQRLVVESRPERIKSNKDQITMGYPTFSSSPSLNFLASLPSRSRSAAIWNNMVWSIWSLWNSSTRSIVIMVSVVETYTHTTR